MHDWSLVGLGAALVLVAAWIVVAIQRWARTHSRRRVQHNASKAERLAQDLLHEHGYRVEAVHPKQRFSLECDGHTMSFELRADLLVTRAGRRYVADVKNGALVASLRHGPTRRQLLEYAVAYQCDGVLLVDMQQRRVQQVRFPHGAAAPRRWWWARAPLWLGATLVALALLLGADGWPGWLRRLAGTF